MEALAPAASELRIAKTTFSTFTGTGIHALCLEIGVDSLVMTGLATSQCVETTARDASDHGFNVLMIEDAQADYEATLHEISLFCSRAVCGGQVWSTARFLEETSSGELNI